MGTRASLLQSDNHPPEGRTMIPAALRMALASLVEIRIPVDSSAIDHIAQHRSMASPSSCTAHRYDITLADAVALLTADSPGQYFNRFIKGRVELFLWGSHVVTCV